MRILLLEDSRAMRGVLREMLQGLGYADVVVDEDGQKGLEHLSQEPFDLLASSQSHYIFAARTTLFELSAGKATNGRSVGYNRCRFMLFVGLFNSAGTSIARGQAPRLAFFFGNHDKQ